MDFTPYQIGLSILGIVYVIVVGVFLFLAIRNDW